MSKPFAWAYIHAGTLVTLWHNNTGGVRSPPVTIADDIHALIRQSVHNNEPPFHLTEIIKQISHPWGYSMQEQPDWEHIFDHTAFLRHRFYQCTFMIANTEDCQAFESATSESSSASTELSDIVLSARLLVCPPQLSIIVLQNNLLEFKRNHYYEVTLAITASRKCRA